MGAKPLQMIIIREKRNGKSAVVDGAQSRVQRSRNVRRERKGKIKTIMVCSARVAPSPSRMTQARLAVMASHTKTTRPRIIMVRQTKHLHSLQASSASSIQTRRRLLKSPINYSNSMRIAKAQRSEGTGSSDRKTLAIGRERRNSTSRASSASCACVSSPSTSTSKRIS